jgi:hypothetical protein
MPTIIAICPYCRAGGVRAPDTALGDSATCPKCKSTYTVLPDDDLPDWAAAAQPDAKFISAPSTEPPKPAPVREARPGAAIPAAAAPLSSAPTGGEPKANEGEQVPADAEPQPVASAAPGVAPQAALAAEDFPAEPRDTAAVLALAALILVGPAVVASQLPFGRFIALGLAGVGLVGGLLCLGAEGRARLFAAGAAGLHFCILMVVLFLPSWLDLDPWGGAPGAPEEPKGPVAVDHGTGKGVPVSPDDWLDAGKSSWQFRDARVSMRAAVGPVELTGPNGAKKTPKGYYLRVALQVRNVGFDREIPLSGWAAGHGAEGVRVTDSAGKQLSPAKFDPGWSPDPGHPAPRAMPGLGSEVMLVFAEPSAKAEFVRVQLPGSALGEEGEIKFRSAVVVPARVPGK